MGDWHPFVKSMIWTQYEPLPWVFAYFTLTVSTLDSFIASRHWHRSNPGSFFEQFFNSKTNGNERNFPKKVNLRWSFEQLPCIRLSRPGSVGSFDPPVKISLSGEFHSLQCFLCSWSGCQVNLEKLKVRQTLGSWWFTICVAIITRICCESLLKDALMFKEVVLLRLLLYQSSIAGEDGIHLKLCHDLKKKNLPTCLMTLGARPMT